MELYDFPTDKEHKLNRVLYDFPADKEYKLNRVLYDFPADKRTDVHVLTHQLVIMGTSDLHLPNRTLDEVLFESPFTQLVPLKSLISKHKTQPKKPSQLK
jgi:hypothetical protein